MAKLVLRNGKVVDCADRAGALRHFDDYAMCGYRPVLAAKVEDVRDERTADRYPNLTCTDCGKEATLIILEADGRIWFYCGMCEVG